MRLDYSKIENNEKALEDLVHHDYFTQVMNGEPVDQRNLNEVLRKAKDAYEEGEEVNEAFYRAKYESKEDKIWREFEMQAPSGTPDELITDDSSIWFPNRHTGQTAASCFRRVVSNGKEYEKGLRYSSLHEVTHYKNLSHKIPLRGSSRYTVAPDGSLQLQDKTTRKNYKETELEISPLWLKWVEQFGVEKHGLCDDMLGTRAVVNSFENNFATEAELYQQQNVFLPANEYTNREEPPKYTGRVKNPFWEFWAKHYFTKNRPRLRLYLDDEVRPAKAHVYVTRYALNQEPNKWVWPEELHGCELPKLSKQRTYSLPRSKVRAKAAAFFQLKQSRKFLAFYTVSFPAGIPDDLAYQLFNTWLTRLRDKKKGVGLKSYLWVAERQEGTHKEKAIANLQQKKTNALQKEGTTPAKAKKIEAFYDKKIRDWKPSHSIHFHLLTNNFMPVLVANQYMRAALKTMKKRGNYPFLDSFQPEKYNGVDAKHVSNNRQRLGYYLTKYITKNDTAIAHAVWRSSQDVSSLFTEELTANDKRELMWKMLRERYNKKDGKQATKIPMYSINGRFVDKTWIPPWVLVEANGLLTNTNQKVYDLMDKGGELTHFLQTAYKQTPIWAIWKELKNLKRRKKALFRKERMQSALKVAKRKEFRELEHAERQLVNNRIKKLVNWAKEEGFEL